MAAGAGPEGVHASALRSGTGPTPAAVRRWPACRLVGGTRAVTRRGPRGVAACSEVNGVFECRLSAGTP